MKPTVAVFVLSALLVRPAASPAQNRTDSTYNFGLKQFALSAAALSVIVLVVDAPVAKSFHEASSAGTVNVARQLDRFGDATGVGSIVGGVAIVGLITGNRAMKQTALHALEGVVLASVTAQVGKHILGRERPNNDPDLDGLDFLHFPGSPAFPSGHTAAAFALATSLGDAIDNPWARGALYTLAAGTGWARMAEEEHWLSDVLAGAAIGIASAKFVSGHTRIFGVRAPQVIVGSHNVGFLWTF